MAYLSFRTLAVGVLGLGLCACDPKVDDLDEDTDSIPDEDPDDDAATTGHDPTAGPSASDTTPEPDPDPDEGGSSGDSTGDDAEPPPPADLAQGGVAVRFADRALAEPPPTDPEPASTSTTTTDGEPAHAPDALMVELSTLANSCEDASPVLPCGLHGSITLIIEPEQLVVGTYALLEDVDAFVAESGEIRDGDPEDCSFGFGSLGGTLEITEIDEFHVAGRLTNTDIWLDVDANVAFDVPICNYE